MSENRRSISNLETHFSKLQITLCKLFDQVLRTKCVIKLKLEFLDLCLSIGKLQICVFILN